LIAQPLPTRASDEDLRLARIGAKSDAAFDRNPAPVCSDFCNMHAQEALGRSSRFEALHLALSSSHDLMRVFGPIVAPEPLFMRADQS
jgi:hypothetical protein